MKSKGDLCIGYNFFVKNGKTITFIPWGEKNNDVLFGAPSIEYLVNSYGQYGSIQPIKVGSLIDFQLVLNFMISQLDFIILYFETYCVET